MATDLFSNLHPRTLALRHTIKFLKDPCTSSLPYRYNILPLHYLHQGPLEMIFVHLLVVGCSWGWSNWEFRV